MGFANNLILNMFSIAMLLIIYISSFKQDKRGLERHRLFTIMMLLTMLLLGVDILSRFDGNAGTIYPVINHVGNFLMFLLNPVLTCLWLLYADLHVFNRKETEKWLLYPLIAVIVTNTVLVICSQFFGWYYYIDSDNIYHRGPLFALSALITIALIFLTFIVIIVNRKKIEKKHFYPLVFFSIPPLVCIALQIVFYGTSLILNGVALSLLILLLNIQNQNINTDYLTGVNNRKKLEMYMKEKISASSESNTFSAIMIDLDEFKTINDTFGHEMGDDALQISSKLLQSCLRANDFIARFGGDEFCIILDVSDMNELEQVICRINSVCEKYNRTSNQPYKLGFSMGYATYDHRSGMKMEEFLKQIDLLMYENKKSK